VTKPIYIANDKVTSKRWLVLPCWPGFVAADELEERAKHAYENQTAFDSILILGLSRSPARDLFKSEYVERVVERTSASVERIRVITVSSVGSPHSVAELFEGGVKELTITDALQFFFAAAVDEVLSDLVHGRLSDICERAPSGRWFEKPSSRVSNYFIRAEAAWDDTDAVYFFALAILKRISVWRSATPGATLSQIFIDSMAVFPIAAAVASLAKELAPTDDNLDSACDVPSIESFHSYAGINEVRPIASASFCLISASSGIALASKWIDTHQLSNLSALTIFSFTGDTDEHRVLVKLEKPQDFEENTYVAGTIIRVKNEWFRAERLPPRFVELKKKYFNLSPRFLELVRSNSFEIESIESRFRVSSTIWRNEDFLKWASELLTTLQARNVENVVCVDEEVAAEFNSFARNQPTSVNALALTEYYKRQFASGTVVGFFGLGSSIDTRQFNEWVARIRASKVKPLYCPAVEFFGKYSDLDSFDRTLRYISPDPPTSWLRVVADFSPFFEFRKLQEKAPAQFGKFVRNGSFYLSESERKVKPGFTGWPDDWPFGEIEEGGILLTMAALIQKQRDGKVNPFDDGLRAAVGEDVLASAANFTERFTDPVLVASMLRLFLTSELDYRHDDANSEAIVNQILTLTTDGKAVCNSEPTAEYLLAIALGRVTLSASALARLQAVTSLSNSGLVDFPPR
jgi:hypothetical protein